MEDPEIGRRSPSPSASRIKPRPASPLSRSRLHRTPTSRSSQLSSRGHLMTILPDSAERDPEKTSTPRRTKGKIFPSPTPSRLQEHAQPTTTSAEDAKSRIATGRSRPVSIVPNAGGSSPSQTSVSSPPKRRAEVRRLSRGFPIESERRVASILTEEEEEFDVADYEGEELQKYLLSPSDFRRVPDQAHSMTGSPPDLLGGEADPKRKVRTSAFFSSYGGIIFLEGKEYPIENTVFGLTINCQVKIYTSAPIPHPGSDLSEFLTRMCQIDHANIERTLGYCFEGGGRISVLTEAQQENEHSLASLLDSRSPDLDLATAVVVVKEVIQALYCLHEEGIVLGDLKPQSVIFKGNGKVKIRVWDAFSMQPIDTYMRSPGTDVRFVAPEICTVRVPQLSEAADIYSLGMLLWAILKKEYPFFDASEESVRALIASKRIPTADKNAWPEGLCTLIDHCLSFDAADRPSLSDLEEEFCDAAVEIALALERKEEEIARLEKEQEQKKAVESVFHKNFERITSGIAQEIVANRLLRNTGQSPMSSGKHEVEGFQRLLSIVDQAIELQAQTTANIGALVKKTEDAEDSSEGNKERLQELFEKQKEEILSQYERDVEALTDMLEKEREAQEQKSKELVRLRKLKKLSKKVAAVPTVLRAVKAMDETQNLVEKNAVRSGSPARSPSKLRANVKSPTLEKNVERSEKVKKQIGKKSSEKIAKVVDDSKDNKGKMKMSKGSSKKMSEKQNSVLVTM